MALFDLKSLFFAVETTFGTEPDADGSDYSPVYAQDINWTPAQDVIERPLQNRSLTSVSPVVGAKGGALTFKAELRGSGVGAGDGVTAGHGEVGKLLEACIGSVRLGEGTTCQAGWTTTSGDVADASGISVGDHVMIGGEIRQVITKAGSTLTLNRALASIPGAATVVYAAANYIPADSGHDSIAFVVKQGDQEWTLLGCKGTLALEGLAAGGRALLSFSFQVDSWSFTTKASLPALNPTAFPKGPVVLGSALSYGNAALPISEFTFDVANTIQPQPATSSPTGRADFVVTSRAAAGMFKPLFAQARVTDFQAGTQKNLDIALGSSQTNAFALGIPVAEIVQVPNPENVNGQLYQGINYRPVQNNGSAPEFILSIF